MSRATASCASSLRIGLIAGLALGLSACQYYAPNTPVARDSTEGITLAEAERLRSRDASRSLAASQIRIPTGGLTTDDGVCRDWLDPCWEELGIQEPQPQRGDAPQLPQAVRPAPAQTFRGVLPCLADAEACVGQRAVVTLFANQVWRATLAGIRPDGSQQEPVAMQGCWVRQAGQPRVIDLRLQNDNLLARLQAQSPNTLLVQADQSGIGSTVTLQLVRQPDVEWLGDGPPVGGSCRS